MKRAFCLINHFIISLGLIFSSQVVPSMALAQTTDTTLDAERTACSKNTAYTWSASLNRCIQNKEAQAARHEVEDCSALTDVEQRKECHKRIAEKKTGLNADPNSLPEGSGGSGGMAMINAAYSMIGLINGLGSSGKASTCTSKKIFGVTALAGTATDIWLKIKAKKAMDALKDKYTIDVKKGAYDAQLKAFQYLREEQQTVKDIASREKKRNMLLMAGYGAASVMALWEMVNSEEYPDCYRKEAKTDAAEKKPEEPKPAEAVKEASQDKIECAGTTEASGVCVQAVADRPKIESNPLDPVEPQKGPVAVNVAPANNEVVAPPDTKKFTLEQKNGVSLIKGENGTSIVGDRIIDRSGTVIGKVDATVEIRKVGVDSPISSTDYKKYGVYSSGATDTASKINFTNSSSAGRTTVNGTTTTINDAKLKR